MERQPKTLPITWIVTALVWLTAVACTGEAAGPTPPPFESDAVESHLLLSTTPDRRLPRALNGATVSGMIYVTFVPESDVDRVEFRIEQ
ncbi:MAG: hypothetical protein R6W77_06900, partial [Trueperaceae bacterium]